ncbi:MAG: tRNA (N(6)-L-threonylcarbamoyladenosine(37)-C(2))-methylthiotransferase MtaB [Desulfurivibrionaceae bacterium]
MQQGISKGLKASVVTLGCKVNQFESASFETSLAAAGVELVTFPGEADLYIINSCAVTAKAGAQSRQLVRRALKVNPSARVIITGCYAQVDSAALLEITDYEACIVGNSYKDQLVDIALSEDCCDLEMYLGDIREVSSICSLPVRRFEGRTRAFLRLQDGCDNFCSYCVVPYTRGRSRSLPSEEAVRQLEVLVEENYREVVLTGIHVGMYGHDLAEPLPLVVLLEKLLETAPSTRFRLSSLEPVEVDEKILALIRDRRNFMPHLHIPLQSGDQNILQKMNRKYSPAFYKEVAARIRSFLPEAAIGVDVLVGFPGEDGAAFLNTYSLLEALPVSYLHVFPYSKRPGTLAATMGNQVEPMVIRERTALLRELGLRKKREFYNSFLGEVREVLVEGETDREEGFRQGFTDNYIPVIFEATSGLVNQVVPVLLESLQGDKVVGRLKL